jgi:hypothetical protein
MWVSFKDEHFSAQTRIFFQPYINYQTLKKKVYFWESHYFLIYIGEIQQGLWYRTFTISIELSLKGNSKFIHIISFWHQRKIWCYMFYPQSIVQWKHTLNLDTNTKDSSKCCSQSQASACWTAGFRWCGYHNLHKGMLAMDSDSCGWGCLLLFWVLGGK